MAAPPTKPGKYCMLDPSPPMGNFNTARSNQVSMTLLKVETLAVSRLSPSPLFSKFRQAGVLSPTIKKRVRKIYNLIYFL